MKTLLTGIALATLALASTSQAAVLLDATNLDGTYNYDLSFVATDTTTTLDVAGYNLPSFIDVSNNSVTGGGSGNLLGGSWNFTPAPAGSDAFTSNDGSSVPALYFGAVVVGSYDTYSQTFATVAGTKYAYTFTYSNQNDPSGLVVSTSGSAVPEAGTWGLMLLGMGMAGAAIRRRKALAPKSSILA